MTFDEAIISVTTADPQILAARIKGERTVLVAGLSTGETILIVSGKNRRRAYAVEVSRPASFRRRDDARTSTRATPVESYSGSYGLYFAPDFGGGPSLLRHTFDFTQKMTRGRELRASGEIFNLVGGGGEPALAKPLGLGLGTNRLALGLDAPNFKLDLLDSELEISRLSLSSYTMRGLHLVSTPDSSLRGLELFAGAARPSLRIFDEGEGRLAGAIMPVAQGTAWRVHSGVVLVAPRRGLVQKSGGAVWQADARFAPDEKRRMEGEVAYAHGGVSWRGRVDFERGPFRTYGELSKLDRRSPFIAIGAQSSGRRLAAFGVHWHPFQSLNASLNYQRTTSMPRSLSKRIELNSNTLLASASYNPARDAHLSFSFSQQELETPANTALPLSLHLQTRSTALKYGQRFKRDWTSELELRLTASSEVNAGARMNGGLGFSEHLRYSWRRSSVTGYLNYKSNTASLAGLILRNPALLPESLRRDYELNPLRFLNLNRERLPELLPGIELPLTRSTEAGVRLQAVLSRLNATSEVRYSTGEIQSHVERGLMATFALGLRLDAANYVQVTGARSFAHSGIDAQPSLTVSYVHRFGAGSGDGLQFSNLLGLNRGRIQGRVFLDLNGDGLDDPAEPGVAGLRIQLDGDRSAVTDARGHFSFNAIKQGEYQVALISDDLGVRLSARTPASQRVFLSSGQTLNVSFGVSNAGFIRGRVFNDLYLTGAPDGANAPGVGGVRLVLRSSGAEHGSMLQSQTVDRSGLYEFRNLLPGQYLLEIDPATLPADFQSPAQTVWSINVAPLQGVYIDVPLVAQRAVSGIVFSDKDGDGLFNPQTDEAIEGARVVAGSARSLTNRSGSYMLRNLPAGRVEIQAYLPGSNRSGSTTIELGPEPVIREAVNLIIRK